MLAYSTSYGAILQTLRYTCDANPGVSLEIIPLEFPCSHQDIVTKTENWMRKWNLEGKGGRVKMIVIDGVASVPGVSKSMFMSVEDLYLTSFIPACSDFVSTDASVFPWRDLAALARCYNILSLIDGAHLIGQLPVDLSRLPSGEPVCDFFVSNAHKWLMSHRSTAMLWVAKQKQELIRTSLPTSFD